MSIPDFLATPASGDLPADPVLCPVNPIGHQWDGLGCRWCPATRTPGEAIVSGLASRRGGNRDSARKLLDAYRAGILAGVETPAVDEAFFVPGRVYTRTLRTGIHLRYVCEHLTTDPKTGEREAWGWLHRTDGTRRMERKWAEDYPKWEADRG